MDRDESAILATVQSRREFLCLGAVGLTFGPVQQLRGQEAGVKHVPWLAEIQRAPEQIPQNAPRLQSLVRRDGNEFVDSVAKWELHRKRIHERWLEFLGPLSRAKRTLPQLEIVHEERIGTVVRQLVRYKVEQDQVVEAYLLRPQGRIGRSGGVAVFHSTVQQSIRQPAGVEGRPQLAFGLNLARRGYVTICPRNYLWQPGHLAAQEQADHLVERHPDSKGMARMLYDAQIAVDILAAQPDVDSDRIGAIGHSLGAKEVLYLAAFDQRLRATVCSEGGIGTSFSNWDASWYLGETISREDFPHEHHELLALVAPRAFLLVGGESADGDRSWPFIESAMPIYRLYEDSGERPAFGYFNHRQGHAVPEASERRMIQWLTTYLGQT